MAEKQRLLWLDKTKGLLICLVVLGHAIGTIGTEQVWFGENLWFFIYSFHMMAFFAVSGYFYWGASNDVPTPKRLLMKELRLVVPTAFFSIINVLLFILVDEKTVAEAFIITIKNFWFMGAIMILDLFFALFPMKKRPWIQLLMLALLWIFTSPISSGISKFFGYAMGFLMGRFFANRMINKSAWTMGGIGILYLVLLFFYGHLSAEGIVTITNPIIKVTIGIPGTYLLFVSAEKLLSSNKKTVFSWLGQYTMSIYMLHSILFTHFYQIFTIGNPEVSCIILFAAGLALSSAITFLMEKSRIFHYILHPTELLEQRN